MATIQKSTKINFYKFVQVKEPSSSTVESNDTVVLAKTINKNVEATNNLGSTLNSFAKVLSSIKAAQLAMLDAAQRKKVEFKANYTTVKKKKKESKKTLMDGFQTPSFLEGLFNFLSGLFKAAILIPALKWLSDPENREKVKTIVDIIGKVIKFIFDVAKFGVVNTIEGLYNLLKDDATWQERLLGFGQALVGIGTIVLGLRYLKNPTKIITDIAKSIKALINFATGGGGRRGGGGTPGGGRRRRRRRRFGRSLGGLVPEAAQGGFISGPQSGYKVSLDGGRSTSFIGHGTEYVARKANGGAFVVPLNTPGTKTQPHLTKKRMGEAKSQGFDLGGMLQSSRGGFKPGKGYGNTRSKNVMPAFAPEAKYMSQGGKLDKQIYLHWTAGGYNWKNGPYHTTVQGDGSLYKHIPYDQHTAHTYYRNTGNVGLSVAAMKDYNWNAYSPKPKQLESMMAEAANVAKTWGWKPSDVSIRNVMTHAEAASNKDGRSPHDNYGPTWWGGTGERSDLHKLKGSDKDGTGGDKLRQMMKRYMGMENPPMLSEAGPGAGGGDRNNSGQINSSEYNLLQRLVLAEAGGEGKLGMALVARSVLNRAGLIQSGKVGPGMFMANDESVTGVIMGRNQYQPVRDGSIDKARTDEDMRTAKEAIELARNPAGLRGSLEAEGIAANNINYLMGSTGFRTGSAFKDPSQNVNVVQYKNHFFNTAGNKGVKTMLAEIENGGTGGGPGAGDYGSNTGGRGSVDFSMDKSRDKTPLSEKAKSLIAQITGGKASSSTGLTIGGAPGALPASKFQATEPSTELEKQTDERNKARQQITERSQSMIQTALAAIAQQNGVNSQAIRAAQTAVQMAMGQSNNQPQLVGGGGSAPQKSVASTLSSTLNPLRGILK